MNILDRSAKQLLSFLVKSNFVTCVTVRFQRQLQSDPITCGSRLLAIEWDLQADVRTRNLSLRRRCCFDFFCIGNNNVCVLVTIPSSVVSGREFDWNVTTTHILTFQRWPFEGLRSKGGGWLRSVFQGSKGLTARDVNSVDSVLAADRAVKGKQRELSVHAEVSTGKVFRKIHSHVIGLATGTISGELWFFFLLFCVLFSDVVLFLWNYEKKLSNMRSKSVPVNIFIRKINTIYGKFSPLFFGLFIRKMYSYWSKWKWICILPPCLSLLRPI